MPLLIFYQKRAEILKKTLLIEQICHWGAIIYASPCKLMYSTILRDSKTEYQWHSNNNNHWVVKRVLFFTKQNSLQQFIPGLLCLTKSHWRINNTVDFCVCYREIHLFSKWKLCCDLTVSAPLKVRSWFCFLNNFLVWTTLAEYFWGVFEMSFVSIIKTF